MHEMQQKEIETEPLQGLLVSPTFSEIGGQQNGGRAFLNVIRERAGLLVARGEGIYAFSPHLSGVSGGAGRDRQR